MTAKTVLHNFIGGEAAAPAEGRYEDLIDPATGEVFASAPVSGQCLVVSPPASLAVAGRIPGGLRHPARLRAVLTAGRR